MSEGVEEKKQKKKRRSPGEAVRLSDRGAFVLCELYKMRRMTVGQAARLCVVANGKFAAGSMCRRLRALGYLRQDDFFRDGSKVVLSLTDAGRRFAVDRLARGNRGGLRDEAGDEFVLHTLRGAELYVELVTRGAKDWLAVRANAEMFDWYSENESVDFIWRASTGFGKSAERRVVPDAVLETQSDRFLIEVERSTKTLRVVMAKIENFCDVFSRFKSMTDAAAYDQKYSDKRAAVVVFMFDSEERANNVRKLVEQLQHGQGYSIPSLFIGTLEETAAFLAKRIGLREKSKSVHVDPMLQFKREVRSYVDQIVYRSTLTSQRWPSNWKVVMSQVYGSEEWAKTERELEQRIANARARDAAQQNRRGVA